MFKSNSKYKIAILLIVLIASISAFINIEYRSLFWDLSVYKRAVYDYSIGQNPYRLDALFLFIYHPYILILFFYIDKIADLNFVFASIFIISSYLFFKQIQENLYSEKIKTNFGNKLSIFWLFAPAICFGGAGIVALQSGNLTLYLHFAVISTFLYIKKNINLKSIIYFLACVVFVSLIKPYYLGYLILLIYLTNYKKAALFSIISVLIFAAIWLSAGVYTPILYEKFLAALTHQTLGQGDLGYAVFGLIRRFLGDAIALFIHVVVMVLALGGAIFLTRRKACELRSDEIMPLAIAFIIFLNPRMKEYDFPIAVLFVSFYMCKINTEIYLKSVFYSLLLATIPVFTTVAVRFGYLKPAVYFTSIQFFQILGFSALSMCAIFSIRNLQKSTLPVS
jgi:hypothetical protein